MAQQPQQQQGRSPWGNFFLGLVRTPGRFIATLGASLFVYGMFRPEQVTGAVEQSLIAILNPVLKLAGQLLEPVLALFFVCVGLRVMWNVVTKKGGGGK